MFAVINDRSRQITVRSGDEILCDLNADFEVGSKVTFDRVHFLSNEGEAKIGKPFLEGVSVTGEVLREERGEKLVVYHFKRRKNIRRKRGHRQGYTRVRIDSING